MQTSPNFEALLRLAAQHGLRCLDDAWHGSRHRYRFRCERGHEWNRRSDKFQQMPACIECRRLDGHRLRLKTENFARLHEIAERRGGACLSETYLGVHFRYRMKCHAGHEWEAYFKQLMQGHWCPQCKKVAKPARPLPQVTAAAEDPPSSPFKATDIRFTDEDKRERIERALERLRHTVRAHGGRCLFDSYHGLGKYRFRCAAGHEWETTSGRVLRGRWCPECSDLSRKAAAPKSEACADKSAQQ